MGWCCCFCSAFCVQWRWSGRVNVPAAREVRGHAEAEQSESPGTHYYALDWRPSYYICDIQGVEKECAKLGRDKSTNISQPRWQSSSFLACARQQRQFGRFESASCAIVATQDVLRQCWWPACSAKHGFKSGQLTFVSPSSQSTGLWENSLVDLSSDTSRW